MVTTDHGVSNHIDEHPAYLLSDLYVNEEQKFLTSKFSPLDSNELFFPACEKVRTLLKLDNDDDQTDIPKLDELLYVPNLFCHLENAIAQILKMGGNKAKSKKDADVAMSDDNTNHQNNNWNSQRSRSNRRTQNKSQDDPRYSPSNSMEITFNSFLLIHPVLKRMMEHPHKDDFSLDMKYGPRIKKKGQSQDESSDKKGPTVKKTQCYLFGERVYSIANVSTVNALQRQYRDLERAVEPLILKATGELDYSRHSDILASICSEPPTREYIIQQTIHSSIDKDIETFGHDFDRIIIHPLSHDRDDLQNSFENSVKRLNDTLAKILPKGSKGFDGFLDVYGSCLSGLSLGRSSDVDISLHDHNFARIKDAHEVGRMPLDKFTRMKKNFVYGLRRQIEIHGHNMFSDMEAVAFARVPVVKGRYLGAKNPFSSDGSLDFDICFLNDIAVVNSALIREYSKIDPRVRSLMLSVKSWAKAKKVGSAADNTLSSYTWMIMVIFYLQIIGFVPNLQCNLLMERCGVKFDPRNRFHSVNGLRTIFVSCDELLDAKAWNMPEEFKTTPSSCLLAGFFTFYSKIFPWETTAVSIRLANLSLQKTVFRSSRFWRMVIEDPFEIHNSHIPHDLGIPLNEGGQNKIFTELRNAANEMQSIFQKRERIVDCIGSINHVHDPSDELKRAASIIVDETPTTPVVPNRGRKKRKGKRTNAKIAVGTQPSSDLNLTSSNPVNNTPSDAINIPRSTGTKSKNAKHRAKKTTTNIDQQSQVNHDSTRENNNGDVTNTKTRQKNKSHSKRLMHKP